MEQYFPVIIAVAVLIYRVYTNFLKEQEKARKRNPAERPPDMYQEEPPVNRPFEYEYQPEPELIEETYSPERPYEPVYKHIKPEALVRESYKEEKYDPMTTESVVINKYKEDRAREVKLGRAIHAPHKHGVKADEQDLEQEGPSAYADFDLHDAVIKSAILNRPEY
ncbi:MAG TPA: hypothetical protein VGD22_06500 [Sphingobacteriaceae bacterium]